MFKNLFGKNKKDTDKSQNSMNSNMASTEKSKSESKSESKGFLSFVLLKEKAFDFEQFKNDLLNTWNVKIEENEKEETLVFTMGDMMVTIGLLDVPVPENEAESAAATNFMWPEGVSVVKEHKAHLIVAVLGAGESSTRQKGILFTKLNDICCNQKSVLGVYTNGSVYSPEMYKDFATLMDISEDGPLPVLNLVWIGILRAEKGFNVCTYGMDRFGKDEIEILNCALDPNELRGILLDLATYVLENDVTLKAGETIGFTADQKWSISRSKGVAVEGMSLKVKVD